MITIGSIVKYWMSSADCLPAMVTKVIDDDTLHLSIFTLNAAMALLVKLDVKRGDGRGQWQPMEDYIDREDRIRAELDEVQALDKAQTDAL